MIDPPASWVAKWQRIGNKLPYLGICTGWYLILSINWIGTFQPGMYAIELIGELPEDVIEECENLGLEYKARRDK